MHPLSTLLDQQRWSDAVQAALGVLATSSHAQLAQLIAGDQRLRPLFRDILTEYPGTIWGAPIAFWSPEPLVLRQPELLPCQTAQGVGWMPVERIKAQALTSTSVSKITLPANTLTAAVFLIKTSGDEQPALDDSYMRDVLHSTGERHPVVISMRLLVPWPNALELAGHLLGKRVAPAFAGPAAVSWARAAGRQLRETAPGILRQAADI